MTRSTSDLSEPHSELPNFSLLCSNLLLFHIGLTLSFLHLYIPSDSPELMLGADSGMRPEQVRSWIGVELMEYAEEGNR